MKYLFIFLAIIILVILVIHVFKNPSNTRDWAEDQLLLPTATITDTSISFKNIRDFSYSSENEYEIRYYDKTFNFTDLTSVDYIVVPFGSIGGAHTFLSFGFNNEEYIAISVEIRKEKEETFSAIKGLLRNYELMYVVASEEDVIKLRTNHRNNDVYLYPTKGAQTTKIALLKDIAKRINELHETPEFYNTALNNCTTNIARHINNVNGKEYQIPWNLNLLLPEHSDKYAIKKNFLDVDDTQPIEALREKYYISNKAIATSTLSFSQKIRVQY